jgi:hypothetical protein
VATLRSQLDTFLASSVARVPTALAQLEVEKNDEYRTLNEQINNMTSRARSPKPGRTRRVTISNAPSSESIQPPARETTPSTNTPRSRATSTTPSSRARTKSIESEPQPEPVKRGRGRPRKSEPAPMVDRTNITSVPPTKPEPSSRKAVIIEAKPPPSRPDPPSQTDSILSTYSELDNEVMEVLDDIEDGIELMEKDQDGDSQMNPPPSPPHRPNLLSEPRTPRRSQPAAAASPHAKSPRSTLERDVVSGMWSLRVIGPNMQTLLDGQETPEVKGTMNLHLAEDKRSLVGEFSLLDMDGVVQSRTLEGRIDGAYARLLFVGQMTVDNSQDGEATNKVFGPSSSQSGYLRFSDGRKGSDGQFTLKGSLHGGGYGKVDFEGVREGEEQPLCASWDDFVD